MKNYQKILALVLAVVMLAGLVACSKGKPIDVSSGKYTLRNEEAPELGIPEKTVDPATVYSQLTYNEKMFYGDYRILGGEKGEDQFAKDSQYREVTIGDDDPKGYSILPYRIEAGPNTLSHMVNHIKEYNWMRLYFMTDVGGSHYMTTRLCAYTVEGNTLSVTPLNTFNVDEESSKIDYSFLDQTWEYTFSFSGRKLTLSAEGSSVTMYCGLDITDDSLYFYVDNYLSEGSAGIDGIDEISFLFEEDSDEYLRFYVMGPDYYRYEGIAQMDEEGRFTLTFGNEETPYKTYQFIYFYCWDDGLILTDGTNTYYYNDDYSDRHKFQLKNFVTEDQTGTLEGLTDQQLEALVEKKADLMADLAAAYQQSGLNVTVDEQTGEIAMDSTVLFAVDQSAISDEGKTFLNTFMKVYTDVVFNEKYEGFVSKIMVEGHTDSDGEYDYNKQLSQARADNVKAYCLSDACGTQAHSEQLTQMLESTGFASDRLIKDAAGNEDKDASRRVSFRFIINLAAL